MNHYHEKHYHAALAISESKPDWENAYSTAEEAVLAIQEMFTGQNYTMRVYNKPLLITLRPEDTKTTQGGFVYECDAISHIIDYQLICDKEGDTHEGNKLEEIRSSSITNI
jgi:hypothetical protein